MQWPSGCPPSSACAGPTSTLQWRQLANRALRRASTAFGPPLLEFDPGANLYDVQRHQDGSLVVDNDDYALDEDQLQAPSQHLQLLQAGWAASTRRTYHRWCLLYKRFAALSCVPVFPLNVWVFMRWLHQLNQTLAGKSVNVAISAVVSWAALNNFENPIVANPALRMCWRAIRRTRFTRVRLQKFPLDAAFLVKCWRHFRSAFLGSDNFVRHRGIGMLLLGVEAATRSRELRHATICNWLRLDNRTYALQLLDTKSNFQSALCWTRVAVAYCAAPLSHAPSAARFMQEIWLPFLDGFGVARHPRCAQTAHSTSPCMLCPRLFPTLPTHRLPGTVSAQAFNEEVRFWLVATGMSPQCARQYAGGSCRRTAATLSAIFKADKAAIAYHLRHKSAVTDNYVDLPERDRLQVSRAIQQAVLSQIQPRPSSANDDFCGVCGDPGKLVLCDGCSAAAHPKCVGLWHVPDRHTPWFCHRCDPRPMVLE